MNRPTVVKMPQDGVLPFEQPDAHRWVASGRAGVPGRPRATSGTGLEEIAAIQDGKTPATFATTR